MSSQTHTKYVVNVSVGGGPAATMFRKDEPVKNSNIKYIQVFKNVLTMTTFSHVIHYFFGGGGW